jgi:hypothetical protein
MANLKVKIDSQSIMSQLGNFSKDLEEDIMLAVESLAASTKERVVEWANNGGEGMKALTSSREKFMKSLHLEQVATGVHIIYIDEEGLFVEDGVKAGSMKAKLLKGRKYVIIPFSHNVKKQSRTDQMSMIRGALSTALKKEGLSVSGKEYHNNDPRTPKLSEVGPNGRLKPIHTFNFASPVWGKGTTPVLHGVNIYQKEVYDSQKGKSIQRDIFTFRTISEKTQSPPKWMTEGKEPKHYLEKAELWAEEFWKSDIEPKLFSKWNGK